MSDRQPSSHTFFRYSLLLTAAVFCITGAAGASVVSQIASSGQFPVIAWMKAHDRIKVVRDDAPKNPATFNNIDYGATGTVRSILDRPVTLSPCTGKVEGN